LHPPPSDVRLTESQSFVICVWLAELSFRGRNV
jgi:hypothetical protein